MRKTVLTIAALIGLTAFAPAAHAATSSTAGGTCDSTTRTCVTKTAVFSFDSRHPLWINTTVIPAASTAYMATPGHFCVYTPSKIIGRNFRTVSYYTCDAAPVTIVFG